MDSGLVPSSLICISIIVPSVLFRALKITFPPSYYYTANADADADALPPSNTC